MRYEKIKLLSSSLGLASAAAAFLAGYWANGYLSSDYIYVLSSATVVAGLSALISIWSSHKFVAHRKRNQVFIIYAHQDIDKAKLLYSRLAKEGFTPWLDVNEIKPGTLIKDSLFQALEQSTVALVLISKNSAESKFLNKEIDVALNTLEQRVKNLSPVIPIRLDDSDMPSQLVPIKSISFEDEKGLDSLMEKLKVITI